MRRTQERFNQIFLSLRTSLANAVSHIVPPKEVEDIVQETYVRVCQVERSGKIAQPSSFMLRTARNLALDYVKRAEYRLVSSVEEELTEPVDERNANNPMEQAASQEQFAQFCEVVRQLPQQCRKAFVLKKVYGYSQKEIAKQMGISENTVEKHISNGLRHCARKLTAVSKHEAIKKYPAASSSKGYLNED